MHMCLSGHCEYGVRIMHGVINDIAVLVSVAQHHAYVVVLLLYACLSNDPVLQLLLQCVPSDGDPSSFSVLEVHIQAPVCYLQSCGCRVVCLLLPVGQEASLDLLFSC